MAYDVPLPGEPHNSIALAVIGQGVFREGIRVAITCHAMTAVAAPEVEGDGLLYRQHGREEGPPQVVDGHRYRGRTARRHRRRQVGRVQRHREGLVLVVGVLVRSDRPRAAYRVGSDGDTRQRTVIARLGRSPRHTHRDGHAARQRPRQRRRHRYRLAFRHRVRGGRERDRGGHRKAQRDGVADGPAQAGVGPVQRGA